MIKIKHTLIYVALLLLTSLKINSLQAQIAYSSITVPASLEFSGSNASLVQVADFNGDGYVDYAYAATTGGAITYMQNSGTGTFYTPAGAANPFSNYIVSSPTGFTTSINATIAADFDADGDLDIWCRLTGAANDLYLRNDNGTYTTQALPTGLEYSGTATNFVLVADFNNDGYVDYACQNASGGGAAIVYMQNNGSGSFSTPVGTANPFSNYIASSPANFLTGLSATSVADFDADGDLDILCRVVGAGNDVYLRNDNGTYTTQAVPNGLEYPLPTNITAAQVGDFSGDGYIDYILATDLLVSGNPGAGIIYMQNNGSGSFSTPIGTANPFNNFTVATPTNFQLSNLVCSIVDIDGDGDLDIWLRLASTGADVLLSCSGAAPKLLSSTPVNGAADVTPNSNIILTFSETVTKGTGNFYIKKYSDGSVFETIDVTSAKLTGSGTSTITITPSNVLASATKYFITYDKGVLKDADGLIIGQLDPFYKVRVPETAKTFLNFTTSNTLPLSILWFNAQQQNNVVTISWQTTNETNVSNINIERSLDGVSFIKINKMAAKGDGIYTYIDDVAWLALGGNTVYYRLQIVNNDGSFTFSKVVSTQAGNNNRKQLSLYPNPVISNLFVQFESTKQENISLQIISPQGKVLQEETIAVNIGKVSTAVNTSTLAKGNYILLIKWSNGSQQKQFVKQ